MNQTLLSLTLSSLFMMSSAIAADIHQVESDNSNQTNLTVTIYNDSLALVNESRSIDLKKGLNNILLKDVSAQIQSETSQLIPLSGAAFQLIEQNFDYDLLTPNAMLNKAIGQTINVISVNPKTGKESTEKAEVLANNNGVIVKYSDRIETGLPNNSRFAFTSIPENLRESPTLSVLLDQPKKESKEIGLTYLTGGFGWKADYVANLSKDETTLDLSGWITLNNQSGTAFQNANVQLVAGELNRAMPETANFVAARADNTFRQKSMVQEETFADYHLYTLPFKTTLNNNQEKQVSLLNTYKIPVTKEYRFSSKPYYFSNSYSSTDQNIKAKVYLNLTNSEENNLGMPLPKGIFRVYQYQESSQGEALFIGEDRINHIAKNEHFQIHTGDAFDVSLTRKQTDFTRFSDTRSQSSHEIIFNNGRDNNVTVNLYEGFSNYRNWKILKESHPHEKSNYSTGLWKINVPAGKKATLTYTVEHRND